MNILFCHDGPVSCDKEGRYYSAGFNDKLFDRYAAIFETVCIATRVDRTNEVSKYSELTKLNVEKYPLTEYPNYLSLRGLFANKSKSTKQIELAILQADALIIRLPSFLGSKCVKIANKYNKPYLIEVVGCPWDSLRNHGVSGKLLAPYMYFLTRAQVKKATDVLYVTDEFLQTRYPTNGRAIGCSDVLLEDTQICVELGKPKAKHEKLILGTAGVLDVRYKGQEFVIKALAELKKSGINAEYWLAGSGTGDYLRKQAKMLGVEDRVKFCGLLDRKALDVFYQTVDVYVQPSLTEGMPRAVIEAMSKGCFCIGTHVGGIPELIGREHCFKKGNVGEIVSKILCYYEDLDNKNRAGCIKRSRDFSATTLEKKRSAFYKHFRNCVEEKK